MFRCPGGWDRAAPAASRNAGVGRVQSARSVILVVEDDAAVRESLHELLARAGHAVICATDGRTALDRVAAGGVDLVLLDLLLPGMDGIALCRELRARPAEAGYLPIIMLTALSSEAERHAGFAAGADDYVTKPFEPAHLLDRVAVWLRTRARLEAAQARLRDERATSARLAEERAAALAAMRAAHERLLAGQAQEERLLREAEARTRTFRVLHELAVAIGGVLDPEALAQLTTDRARDLLGVDSVSLWWWDAEAALLRRLAGHVPYPERAPQALRAGEGAPGVAFAQCAPTVVDDYPVWAHAAPAGTRSGLQASGERTIGALGAYTFTPRRFSSEDMQLLALLAAQVGPALEAARLYVESERRRAEVAAEAAKLRRLAEIAAAITAEADLRTVLELLVQTAADAVGLEQNSLLLLDAERGTLAHAAAVGLPAAYTAIVDGLAIGPTAGTCGVAAFRGETVITEDVHTDPNWALFRNLVEPYDFRAVWSVPLLGKGGRVLGTFAAYRPQPGRPTPQQLELLTLYARLAAVAVENARSYAREEHLAREAAARAAELAAVFEQLPCGVTLVDAAGRLVLKNEAGRRLWGEEPTPGEPIPAQAPYYEPRDAATGRRLAPAETTLGRALAGERVEAFEYIFRRPGAAADTWVQSSAVPLRDAEGRVAGAVGVFSDVTRERQLVRALAASEERLRLLYHAMACGVLVRDAKGAIVDANEAAEEILGYALAEMRGKRPDELWVALDEGGAELDVAERPSNRVLRTGLPLRQYVMAAQRRDGERRWIQNDAVPVRGPDGQVLQIVSSFIDITERKRAEEERARLAAEIEQERAMLAAVVNGMSDGLLVVDAASHIRFHNERARALVGGGPEPLVGMTVEEAFARHHQVFMDPAAAWAALQDSLAHLDERPSHEVSIVGPPRRELRVQFFPVASAGGAGPGWGALLHDVTHTRLLGLLQERERIAMDLHDGVIQSLYAVALGLGARARALDSNGETTREALRAAVAQINAVIQDVRNYIFDLRLGEQAARGVRAGLEALAAELRINALVQPELAVDPAVDRLLSPEAAANLLQIAREATANVIRHAGATAVWITLAPDDARLALTVRDNGRGFDPARESAASAGGAGGQGLRNMAERARLLGGRLAVRSEPGQGATVRLEVPLSHTGGDEWPTR